MTVSSTFVAGQVLTATDANVMKNSGLVYVAQATLSALSNNIDGCFSNDYENYRVVVAVNSVTANSVLALRLRASGTNNTSAVYYWAQMQINASGGSGVVSASSDTSWTMGYTNTTIPTLAVVEIEGPYKVQATMATLATSGDNSTHTAFAAAQGGLMHYAPTYQADGLNIFTSSGVLNGFVTVYGYRKA